MNALITKSFVTSAAIGGYLIVKASATDRVVSLATANTDLLLGAADPLGAGSGSPLDIALAGIGEVRLGGTVKFGEPITANAASKGVKATPDASTQVRIIGYALADGVADDIIAYTISLGQLSKASA